MIIWKPIETAPSTQVLLYVPPLKLREYVVFVGRADECRRSATHWAPINLPGEPTSCETCGKQLTCPWTDSGRGHCNGWSKCV